ncbi:hypothetical protein CQA09_28635, partial [Klebsiella pneumoniae]
MYRLEISNPPATYHLNYTPNFESSVETKYYSGGFPMPGSPSFIKGGTGSGSILPNHNVYRLEISNPPATYHLNYTPNFESS